MPADTNVKRNETTGITAATNNEIRVTTVVADGGDGFAGHGYGSQISSVWLGLG
jgi:hypothetical protein